MMAVKDGAYPKGAGLKSAVLVHWADHLHSCWIRILTETETDQYPMAL
jgi:hypothetical protein